MADQEHLEVRTPKLFASAAVLVVNAFGLLAFLPVLVSFLVVSRMTLGWITVALPLAAVALATFFLPLAFGNPYVVALVRRLGPPGNVVGAPFLVQLRMTPRLQSGPRAWLEDADDIGWLVLSPTGLEFQGDATTIRISREQILSARSRSIGWRGLFLSGPRLELEVTGMGEVTAIEFSERSSWTLPGSRRLAGQMRQRANALGLPCN